MALSIHKLYRKLRYGEPIVVVSGLPRSGTSMAMQMLEAGGVDIATDGIREPGEDNPKGYFEYERVKDLDKESDKSWLGEFRGKAVKIISFLLKDLPPTNNYKIVFMRRDLDEVLASQSKMLARRGEKNESDDRQMRELFENHLWKVNYLLKHRPQFDTLFVDYRNVIANPKEEADRLRAFLDNRVDAQKMASAVDEQLYRNRAQPRAESRRGEPG